MPSTFSWLDYSDHERRKVLDVVELFGEKTTVDEIGIGSVRDAIADAWFPGTSTIQTTAKYFFLVPWTYLSLEHRSVGSDRIADYARKIEIKTIQALVDAGTKNGVIGRIAKESLQRLPSGVYWQGLLTWGIRRTDRSQDVYHRTIDSYYQNAKAAKHRPSEFEGESLDAVQHNWDPELPPIPTGFPDGVAMDLTHEEASYLRHRIIHSCHGSLLASLAQEDIAIDGEPFVWELDLELSPKLQEHLEHGRLFSEVIHGAQLLYNIILAEMQKWDEQIERFRETWVRWAERMDQRRNQIQQWDLARFWTIVDEPLRRVSPTVKRFVEAWIQLVRSSNHARELWDNNAARELIKIRERQIKKGLARVLGGRPLELWSGESGSAQLDFRWRNTRRIYLDIQKGLQGS
ncbi:MAG: DUF6361 family protein [Planctomycetota bacterium]|nr:DUF6361 family protein [Planctomycetota bacterium]